MGKYLDLARRAVDVAPETIAFTQSGYELNELNETSTPPRDLTGSVDAPAEEWDAETLHLIEWFKTATPPTEPFNLCQGVTILDPARWWRSIADDIEFGPNGPRARYGVVQGDLRRLHELKKGKAAGP